MKTSSTLWSLFPSPSFSSSACWVQCWWFSTEKGLCFCLLLIKVHSFLFLYVIQAKTQDAEIRPSNQSNLANLNRNYFCWFFKILNQCSELLRHWDVWTELPQYCIWNRLYFHAPVNTFVVVSVRNSDRLGNGVLYASVNPEYFSAAESECVRNVAHRFIVAVMPDLY